MGRECKSCRRGGAKDPWFGTLDHRRKESASDLLFGGLGSRNLTTGDAKDLWVGILDHRFKRVPVTFCLEAWALEG